jgi:hypothetical protein
MKNIVNFEIFEEEKMPGSEAAGAEVAPTVFGKTDFSVSGVTNEAMQSIAALMAYVVISGGDQQEASRVVRMVKSDPSSAASYLSQRVPGIVSSLPCVDEAFKDKLIQQKTNLAKGMVTCIPGLVGGLVSQVSSQTLDFSKMLKPDVSRSSYFSKLGEYLGK